MSKSNVSEGAICRSVIDRNEVMKDQIILSVREILKSDVSDEQQILIAQSVTQIIQSHTNGVTSEISHEFSKK